MRPLQRYFVLVLYHERQCPLALLLTQIDYIFLYSLRNVDENLLLATELVPRNRGTLCDLSISFFVSLKF